MLPAPVTITAPVRTVGRRRDLASLALTGALLVVGTVGAASMTLEHPTARHSVVVER